MRLKIVFFTLALFVTCVTSYGQLLTFDFVGLAGSEVTANSNTNNANLTSSTISRGAGLTASNNGDRFNATSWALTSIANAVTANDYMEFTITPNSGFQFSVSSIVIQWQRSDTGNTAIALRSSVDGYANNLDTQKAVTDNTNTQPITFTFAQANSSTAVTYRLYSYAEATGGSGGPGDGTGNDIIVNGTVTQTSPTVNGAIAANEYGTHIDGNNQQSSGASATYMTWDTTNLYIAVNAANTNEGFVLYLDKDPQALVNGGTNTNGTNVGFNYDGTSFAELPYRADLVLYVKNGYKEYRTANGGNGWNGPITSFGSYAETGGTVREFSIPWSAIGGMPASFNHFSYVTRSGGSVYAQTPTENANGSIGTSARYSRYYTVSTTTIGSATPPFSRNSFVFNSASDVTSFGPITAYDFTMNSSGRYLSRTGNTSGNWTIAGNLTVGNGTVYLGSGGGSYGTTAVAGNLNLLGGTFDMDQTNAAVSVTGNVDLASGATLKLSGTVGGDLNLAGNWTNSGTFTPNNRAVTFNGTGNQTITNASGETFNYLINNKASGTLTLANNVTVNGSTGSVLQLLNAGGFDLNGKSLTLSGAGGDIQVTGGARTITSSTAASINITGDKTVSGSGTLILGTNLTTLVGAVIDFGSSKTTINGILQINSGYVSTNSPIYGNASTLKYNFNGTFGRTYEWFASGVGTINVTPGYPNNVQLSNNTTLNYLNTTSNAVVGVKAMAGNLTVDSGSTLNMDFNTSPHISSGGALVVAGSLSNAGTLTLGFANGDDLKVGGDFTNTGTFNGNNRAVFFIRSTTGTQLITASAGITIPYIVIQPAAGTDTVQLATGTNLTISAPLTGIALTFTNATDILDINSNTLTIGTSTIANTITGPGTFKGSTASNLTLLGTGSSIGTLKFANDLNLRILTIDRTSGVIGATLASALTINNSLVLNNGLLDLAGFNLTMAAAPSGTITSSTTNFIIADGSGELRKIFTANSSFTFPIGDNTTGLEYSPATINFANPAATYGANSYVGMKVRDEPEPNNEAPTDFITRYWNLTSANITNATYDFTGTYLPADISGIETNYKSGRLRTSNLTWFEGTNSGANTVSFTGLLSSAAALDSSGGYNFTAGNPFKRAEINIQDPTPTTYLSGSEYNFGTVSIGSFAEVIFTIKNSGLEDLTLGAPTLTGTGYSLQTNYTSPVVPSGTTTFTVRFAPINNIQSIGKISIPNNDPTGSEAPYEINFKGIGDCLKVDFEGAIKGAYPSAEVDINGKSWLLTEALIGNAAEDIIYVGGGQSIRMRSNVNANAEILEDQTLGMDIVKFKYVRYNNDATTANFKVEYSKDSGNSWFQLGPTFTPTTSVQTFNQTLNQSGPVRIRIKYDSGTVDDYLRMNIDDIESCSYLNSQEIEVFGNLTTIQNGSTPKLTNLTKFTDFFLLDPTIINTYTVTNTGTGTLTLTNPTYTGSADFTISTLSSTSLVAGASATFTISFTSTVGGLKTGTVSIGNNDSDESPFTFNITAFVKSYVRCALEPVAVIAQQDFELSPASPILAFNGSGGTFTSTGGAAYGANRTSTSNKFIGARSYQVTGAGGTNTLTSTSSLNLSSYKNIVMSFNIGGYSVNTTNGLDTSDEVRVSISTDGGTTWKEQLFIRGNSNSIFDINSATGSPINVVYDATLTTGLTFGSKSSSMNTFSRTFTISSLPNSTQLKIKFTIIANHLNEVWAIDNVKLEGQLPKSTTWNGTAWSSGVPPTSSTKAIFDGDYTTDLIAIPPVPSIKTCECQINATRTVTVSADDYLEIQSDLTNNGTLIIENDGSLVQVNDDAVNTGNIRYERTTPPIFRTDYTYWSSPVAGYTLGGVSQNKTLWDKYYSYDSSVDAWKQESSATSMLAGIGYIIRGDETEPLQKAYDAFFIGIPNNGVYTITGISPDKSYLLGNPYPSALDADTFLAANSNVLDGTLYFWTHKTPLSLAADISNPGPGWAYTYSLNDYAAYNPVGGVGIDDVAFLPGGSPAPNGSAKPTGKIASGQGFFASSKTIGDGFASGTPIVFNNSMRVDNLGNILDNSQFFKTRNTKEKTTTTIEKHRIWLNLTNTLGAFKQTLVGYITDATNEYDSRFDGESFDANEFVDFYSLNQDKNLVIQGRALPFNDNDEVPLGFRTTIEGPFTINIDQVDGVLTNQAVFIEDKLTNTVFDLKTGNYTFNTVAGTFNERFILRYTNKTLGNKDFESLENQVLVSNKNKQIKVNSAVETIDKVVVYDLLGRQLFKKDKVNCNELALTNLVSSQQTLLVKVSLQNGQTVTKKIIY